MAAKSQRKTELLLAHFLPSEASAAHAARSHALRYPRRWQTVTPALVVLTASGVGEANQINRAGDGGHRNGARLVHDDMPAMVNDSLRRGKPTYMCNTMETTAQHGRRATQTFDVLQPSDRPTERQRHVVTLARASVNLGMAGGQIPCQRPAKPWIRPSGTDADLKTGALIRAAVALGALSCQT